MAFRNYYVCDRCNVKVDAPDGKMEEIELPIPDSKNSWTLAYLDLCNECIVAIAAFIKPKRERGEHEK